MTKKFDYGAIAIKPNDNVATALREITAGETVSIGIEEKSINLKALDAVQFGHKLAIVPISKGTDIIKYGVVIGRATADIALGEHAHVQNIESLRGRGDQGGN